jgi:hypothetical protein
LAAAADADPPTVLAQAQQRQCGPLQEVQKTLASEYGETVTFIGAAGKDGNLVVATFLNHETNSFTILVVNPDGVACLIAAGEKWKFVGKPS